MEPEALWHPTYAGWVPGLTPSVFARLTIRQLEALIEMIDDAGKEPDG